ncbi:MAG: non-ribosomal peptide synthetase, partial [bacterium]|nr:non-ribosomal peptide synthetase [bacterium]
APTVAALARCIAETRRTERGVEIPPPQPLPRDRDLPLSFAQQRLWFIDQMDPGNPAYNLALPVRLRGRLELDALAGSLSAVRRRHEVLRTTFTTRDGKPVQVIASVPAEGMALVDLRALPEAARERETRRLARDDAARPFDLGRGPLLRTAVLRLADDDHVFLLTMHHIVTDGWSMEVLIREVVTLYGAAVRDERSPLPELGIQYADFAGWQRQWLEKKVFAAQLETWKNRLRPPLAVVELPADRPRPALRTYRGTTRGISLSDPLSTALRGLARREG